MVFFQRPYSIPLVPQSNLATENWDCKTVVRGLGRERGEGSQRRGGPKGRDEVGPAGARERSEESIVQGWR